MGLKITAEVNYKTVNFLDVTLNLTNESYKPRRKPNNDLLYIHKESNHPPSITKQLPAAINRRIASLSSDKQTFDSFVSTYDNALKQSNYNTKLQYSTADTTLTTESRSQNEKHIRTRKSIWFNPPYSKNVRTNVALVSYAYLLSGLSPHVRYAYFGQEFLSSKLANHSFTHENCGA
jgi:hypothetical protein